MFSVYIGGLKREENANLGHFIRFPHRIALDSANGSSLFGTVGVIYFYEGQRVIFGNAKPLRKWK